MFFRAETKRVRVDLLRRDTRVVLVRLYKAEVVGRAFLESVVAVERDLGLRELVARVSSARGGAANRRGFGREIEPVVARRVDSAAEADSSVVLEYSDEFLRGVVERHAVLDTARVHRGERFFTLELELFDEVFVRYLGELAAFFRIKVYVIYPDRGVDERRGGSKCRGRYISDNAFDGRAELDIDLDFVVLERNEG